MATVSYEDASSNPGALVAWAQEKFGRLIGAYAPTDTELLAVLNYFHGHPGAPTDAFVNIIAAQRKSSAAPGVPAAAAQGAATPKRRPTDPSITDSPTAPTAASTATPAAGAKALPKGVSADGTGLFAPGLPPEAYGKTGQADATWLAKHGNVPAVKDWITKNITGPQGQSQSAILGQFAGDTPVYIQSPITSAPNANLPGATRGRLGREDQLATGTGDTTGGILGSTYQDVMTGLYKLDDAGLKALKQRLWAGGFYPSGTDKSITDSPIPDVATRTAYEIAVQQSARLAEAGHRVTVDSIIAGGNPDPSKATGAATTGPYTITNPADLETALQSAAQERLGRDLTKAEIGNFASLYQGMEAQSSQRYAAAGRNNQEIGIVAPPSPGSASTDYLDQKFAAQEQAYGAVRRQQEFFGMLGPIAGHG